MSYSFYQALLIVIPIAGIILLLRKYMRPNIRSRVKKEIESRLFAESPTFVIEDLVLEKNSGGFYSFRVEGLVVGLINRNLEIRIVEGTHSGKAFLTWTYQKPENLDLKVQYSEMYPKPL